MPDIAGWENFYVIVGSAAGALIGLQFVVMTLIAERPPPRVADAGRAFSTPTIVHFAIVLAIASILCAPWATRVGPAIVCGLIGLHCFVYVLIGAYRMRTQTLYKPDGEDWTFHVLVPLVAYTLFIAGAAAVFVRPHEAMFAIAAATLILLFDGIHNAWDAIAWHVAARSRERNP